MISNKVDSSIAKFLYFGVPAVSLFLVTGSISDPVNVTKFLILGGVGVGAWFYFCFRGFKSGMEASSGTVVATGLFLAFGLVAVIASKSPLSQNLYGVYGRNTGYLAYFFLCGILLTSLCVRSPRNFNRFVYGLFITGLVNVLYCGWVVAFGDFIGWENPYGHILGLFGNPNFIGAFLGMWISTVVALLLGQKYSSIQKLALVALILLAAFEVYKSHAVQGVVVSAAGVATVLFFYIRSRFKSPWVLYGYTSAVLIFGFVALLGALQKGPLSEIIYKTSVSLRGSYWRAGIETGIGHPFTGVGMDSYGDWYRRSRSVYAATSMPGPSTVTNSAHNVIIDIFSYGGFPLLFSYLGILLVGALAIFRGLRRTKSYDATFVALSVAWIGYQLQSIISINQIGLAVWGWSLTGMLVAYEYSTRNRSKDSDSIKPGQHERKNARKSVFFSSNLIVGLGAVLGFILAAPPMASDMAWVQATRSGNFLEVQKALVPTYMHPQSVERYVNAVVILENSKLFDQARDYALKATELNPESFDAWFALYSVKNGSPKEKATALKHMKLLDPNNPETSKL